MAALAERRMMGRDQERFFGLVLCNFCQCRPEPVQLRGVVLPGLGFALQEAGIFQLVRVQADDPQERRIEQPVDTRLRHVFAEDAASRRL